MKRIYIDMDGVLAKFLKRQLEVKRKFPNLQYPQSQYGFFSRLEPIENAIESVIELNKHYDVWFLTRPSFNNIHCYSEKAEWILNYFGFDLLQKLIICGDKSLVKGDYLIDDSTIHGQTEFEGELILFGSDKFKDWIEVKKYLLP
jgi:5'-nucleotidase